MKKTFTKAATLLTVSFSLVLTGCGSNDWTEEERTLAWERQLCQDLSRLSGSVVASSIGIDLLADNSLDKSDRLEALDAMNRLNRSNSASEVVNPQGGWNCQGWVWEHHKSENAEIPEDFTQELAEERGLLNEQ